MPSEIRYVKRVLLTVGIVLTVAALVTVFCLSIRVWLALFAGILLGVFFRTLAFWVGKLTRLPAVWALVVVVITLLGLAVLGAWIVAPQVANQFAELSDRLPKALETIRARV
ncbi:MAG TPA: hypothetical protein VEC99_04050, partial [Clostridia bacterium]|nr:hypothetical protein [Clostridia bacterium]